MGLVPKQAAMPCRDAEIFGISRSAQKKGRAIARPKSNREVKDSRNIVCLHDRIRFPLPTAQGKDCCTANMSAMRCKHTSVTKRMENADLLSKCRRLACSGLACALCRAAASAPVGDDLLRHEIAEGLHPLGMAQLFRIGQKNRHRRALHIRHDPHQFGEILGQVVGQ